MSRYVSRIASKLLRVRSAIGVEIRTCHSEQNEHFQLSPVKTPVSDCVQATSQPMMENDLEKDEVYDSDLISALKAAKEKYGVRGDPFTKHFDVEYEPTSPSYPASFNAAGFVNKSPLLQEFVKMGVDLTVWERQEGVMDHVLKLDFQTGVVPYIRLLTDYGLEPDRLGWFFTKNPQLLQESIEDLQVRLNYLESKKFKPEMIARIISKNPKWLSFSTKKIDEHLGYFQKHFKLTGTEVRHVATVSPKVITQSLMKMETLKFAVWEEMGFTKEEVKKMLLAEPKIFLSARLNMTERFNYFHNIMKIPHEAIVEFPAIFRTRQHRLRERHEFLKHLGRNEYGKSKEGYISLKKLVSGTDGDFAVDVAESSIDVFNNFLKSI